MRVPGNSSSPNVAKKDHPAVHVAAVITLTGASGVYHAVDMIQWSYDLAPTAGGITIVSGSTTICAVAITAAGPGFLPFGPICGGEGETVTITLADGGSGVTGKLNAQVR